MVLSEIVPRGQKPIFFDDSPEGLPNNFEIPDKDPFGRLKYKIEIEEDIRQYFKQNFQICFECVIGVPDNSIFVYLYDEINGRIGQIKHYHTSIVPTPGNVRNHSFLGYMPIREELADVYTFATDNELAWFYVYPWTDYGRDGNTTTEADLVKLYDKLNNKALNMDYYYSPLTDPAEIGWFPGQFPITPYYHMVFWQGHSFYIPDRFEINEYFSRRSDAYLVCEPINPILKIRGTTGSIGLNTINPQKTHSGFVKSLQGIYESLDTIGRDVNRRLETLSERKRFGKKTSSVKRGPTIDHPIDYRTGKPTVYQSEPNEQKEPMFDMEFVKKFRLIKILKYNIAAYGRNIDYSIDGAGDLPNIYEVSSKDDTNIINMIRILESIDQMGISDLKSFIGV